MRVVVQTKCSDTIREKELYLNGGVGLMTVDMSENSASWLPQSDEDWHYMAYDLSEFIGEEVLIRFENKRHFLNVLLLDDVAIKELDIQLTQSEIMFSKDGPCTFERFTAEAIDLGVSGDTV